jgi:hypothetical protein
MSETAEKPYAGITMLVKAHAVPVREDSWHLESPAHALIQA